ncbi:transcriptional activator SPT8 [Kwoniella heveanensis BCC8398]|uniref:Transcriptional activator SPT8 n=1 Tax=Kwoniella heveanensis BCC8398 TaxID=1296120 RepID=A0A1B9GIE2_9TREE|nr:transcriptional activator SPT8 [Kwoniella heveanensis BCC8398]
MRSDEEDDEDEYYDEKDTDNENEEDDDDGIEAGGSGMNGEDDDGEGDDGSGEGSDDDASDDDNADAEGDEEADEADNDVDVDVDDEDGEGDEDEDEEVDVDADGDADAEDDEEDGEDNENEDEDEEEHDQEGSTEDEGDSKEEGDAEDVDVDIAMDGDGADDDAASSHLSQRSKLRSIRASPANLPPPPFMIRRSLFAPSFTSPPKSLSIEAIVGIPLPSPVHSLATTACLSYVLAGSQDGYVRAYDLWASINGGQMMTAQQRSVVGLGETVSKAGVGRGWWANEVEGISAGGIEKRSEPVYSMAAESDGLWALTGTQSGPINLYTMRHAPGHLVHSLKGHTNVVSCMALLPSEKGFLSGSWDGTVREWDLNTGQTVRTYPTHGAQLSSISLRPFSHPASPTPTPSPPRKRDRDDDDEGDDKGEERKGLKADMSISMGPDFFREDRDKKDMDKEDEQAAEATIPTETDQSRSDPVDGADINGNESGDAVKTEDMNGDVEMSETKSPAGSMDSLFGGGDDGDGEVDADAEGETVPPSLVPTSAPTPLRDVSPTQAASKAKPFGLALPGQAKPPSVAAPAPVTAPPSPQKPTAPSSVVEQPTPASSSAPLFVPHTSVAGPSHSRQAASQIPLLSPTSYKAFSDDILLTSSMDGQVVVIDRRVPNYEGTGAGVGRLQPGERAPPWCMSASWLSNGNQVLAGRRNGTIDIWDLRRSSSSSSPNLLRTLRTPAESGPVSCVVAFPDGQHVAT